MAGERDFDLPDNSVNVRELAQNTAADLTQKMFDEMPPGETLVSVEPEAPIETVPFDTPEEAGDHIKRLYDEEGTAPAPTAEPAKPITIEGEEFTDATFTELLNYGIDLGVPPSQVAPEMREAYETMASTVINVVAEHRMTELQQTQKAMQLEEFMAKVEDNPMNLLKLMVINKPEVFEEAINLYQTIQESPRERELLQRELEVTAQQEAFQRQATAQQRSTAQAKATRVKAITEATAKRYNVNPTLAAQMIAMEVRNTRGREPTPTRVAELISQLRPESTPHMVSPQKQQQVQQTPTQPLQRQAPVEPRHEPRVSSGLTPGEPVRMRGLIKDINRRLDAAGHER